MEYTRPYGVSLDAEVKIKDAVVAHINSLSIAEDVIWANMFAPATMASGATIKSIKISRDAGITATTDILIGQIERPITEPILVTMTEV